MPTAPDPPPMCPPYPRTRSHHPISVVDPAPAGDAWCYPCVPTGAAPPIGPEVFGSL